MSESTGSESRDRTLGTKVSLGGDREIYDEKSLPIVKRTWFWLLAALLILGSGIVIGMALQRLMSPAPVVRVTTEPLGRAHAEAASLDVRRNRYARRVAELERVLAQDVCRLQGSQTVVPGGVAGVVQEPSPAVPPATGEAGVGTGNAPTDGASAAAAAGSPPGSSPLPQSPAATAPSLDGAGPTASASASADPEGRPAPAGAQPIEPPATQTEPPPRNDMAQPEAPSPGQSGPPSTTRFGDVLGDATLLVISDKGGETSIGSGFLISPSDVVTNAHVVAGGPREVAIVNKALGSSKRASVLGTSWQKGVLGGADFALLRLSEPVTNIKPLELSLKVQKAQEVIAAGFPGEDVRRQLQERAKPDSTFTRGSIRIIEQYQGRFPVINHDADIRKGNSGGPLVDKCGRVLGVNTYALENLDFALSTQGLLAFLKQQPSVKYRLSNEECVS